MGHHIFISYSRDDKKIMESVRHFFHEQRLFVWSDDDIEYGDDWRNKIEEAIQKTACFVALSSPSAKKSTWVKREIILAVEMLNKPSFVILARGDAGDSIPMMLLEQQYVDIRQELEKPMMRLCRTIKLTIDLPVDESTENDKDNLSAIRPRQKEQDIYELANIGDQREGWRTVTLGDVVVQGGKRNNGQNTESGKYPLYGRNGIREYITTFDHEEPALLVVRNGTRLIDNPRPELFLVEGKFSVDPSLFVLRPKSKEIHLQYIAHYLKTIDHRKYLSGITMPSLIWRHFASIPVPLPPVELQRQISKVISEQEKAFADLRESLEQELDKINDLESASLYKLLYRLK